ncbi:MAG: amidohydrolase family protein, partial [Pyrinomonadaceae bacterium]
MRILSADYVLAISTVPIERGAVAINGSEIAAVDTHDALREKFPDVKHEDFGPAAILPGFVNCHSHLELTSMRGALDSVEHVFGAWLLKINELRRVMTEAEIEAAAADGALEGARAGVTCFGDIGRLGQAGSSALEKIGLRGVVFQETEFSPDDKTADDAFENLKHKFFALREKHTDLIEIGLS